MFGFVFWPFWKSSLSHRLHIKRGKSTKARYSVRSCWCYRKLATTDGCRLSQIRLLLPAVSGISLSSSKTVLRTDPYLDCRDIAESVLGSRWRYQCCYGVRWWSNCNDQVVRCELNKTPVRCVSSHEGITHTGKLLRMYGSMPWSLVRNSSE